MKKSRPNILFVGSFVDAVDGSTGGQNFACKSLINSTLRERFNFIKIDSTAKSVPVPPVYLRFHNSIFRILIFLYYILFKDIRSILIFSSAKLSFVEKGFMVLIASLLKNNVIFAPRSGLTLADYNTSKFMRWFITIVIRKSSYVLCQGTNWKIFYSNVSKSVEEKFVVIHNWIDSTKYLPISSKKYNPLNKVNLIYIGWLEDYKGIKDLLDALKILVSNKLNFHCKIYGNGSQYFSSEKFIESNNLKEFISLEGWANEEAKLNAFRCADILIHPSHNEGFPNALIEAMAVGLPVIVSDILAVSDIIINGYNGITFEPRNPNSLAFNIERLIYNQDLKIKIGANARNTVIEKFAIEIAVKKLEKIL